MEPPVHSMNSLFDQLGLPSEETDIEDFLDAHSPLATNIPLPEAPFWSPAQASFLREKVLEDADWAEVIDELNAGLHIRLED